MTSISRFFGIPDDSVSQRRQKFVDGLRFRAVVSVVFLAVFFFLGSPFNTTQVLTVQLATTLIALALVNIVYWHFGRDASFPLWHFYCHWLVDLIVITLILNEVGGIDVPYGCFAYLMIVVTSATFLSKRASFVVASGAALTTMLFGFLQIAGLVTPFRVWAVDASTSTQTAAIIFAVVFYYVFAYLAGTLADQLKDANVALNRAKAEIQEQNRLLESKVATRTHELERRNSEIEEFVHIVTHDLKNVSVGTTETTRRLLAQEGGHLSERGRKYALHVLEDTRQMNQMLLHLLSIFRLSQQEDKQEVVDLDVLVRELLRLQEPRLEAKRVAAHIGALGIVLGDETQIRHVLANLLDNAIKYVGDKPSPEIDVTGRATDVEYVVRVTDNGVGIPQSQKERIFQLYHRAPEQVVAGELQHGEGVGLAISRRIVERWGGRLWVDSTEGHGSVFCFSIPLNTADMGHPQDAHS